jgi:hypothetical protein
MPRARNFQSQLDRQSQPLTDWGHHNIHGKCVGQGIFTTTYKLARIYKTFLKLGISDSQKITKSTENAYGKIISQLCRNRLGTSPNPLKIPRAEIFTRLGK